MHGRRTSSAAVLSALLALGGTTTIASGNDEELVDEATTAQGLTGELVVMEEDGRSVYYLQVGEELISLSFGPSWFTDLAAMFGLESVEGEVELDGNLREMSPNENASDTAKAKAGSTLKVKTFNGESRPTGKPAWAGGPKEQGAAHPGYDGWSKGQANREADNAKHAERKAAKAAAKAEAKAARAAAKSNRRGE